MPKLKKRNINETNELANKAHPIICSPRKYLKFKNQLGNLVAWVLLKSNLVCLLVIYCLIS